MFGFLKKKLQDAVDKFTKKAEEEALEPDHLENRTHHKPKTAISTKGKKTVKEKLTVPHDQVLITYFSHSTSTDNEKHLASGHGNPKLSEKGLKQAEELKSQHMNEFDAVFCSDLKRAEQTAKIAFENYVVDIRLREIDYGQQNQTPSWSNEEKKKYIETKYPSGESYHNVEARVGDFLNYLFENYKGMHIALVAHQAPQLALEVLLNNKTWEQAFDEDWRNEKKWQPGWDYILKSKIKKGFLSSLFKKDKRESSEQKGLFEKLSSTVTQVKLSENRFDELFWNIELTLLENNVAVEVIHKIKEDLKEDLVEKRIPRKDLHQQIINSLKSSIIELFDLEKVNLYQLIKNKRPYIILILGVNGSGKTTTIAKLVNWLKKQDLEPVVAACDTFRAAAIQQLEEHTNKLDVKLIKHNYGSDPAAVAFDAIQHANNKKKDVVLIDTAGRLHSNKNLMMELEKIVRVAKPDFKIFVGESIAGNDLVEQVRLFNSAIGIDGIILAKADIDEKGGAALSVSHITGKPVLFLGTGQDYDDLIEFDKDKLLNNLGLS